MGLVIITIFIFGYLAIVFEHNIKIDKTASALLTGVLIWVVFVIDPESILGVNYSWSFDELINNSENYLKHFQNFLAGITNLNEQESVKLLTYDFIVHELERHIIEIAELCFFLIGAMTIVELIDTYEGFSVVTDRIHTTKRIKLLWIIGLSTFFFSGALDNLTASILMCAVIKKLVSEKNDLWLFAGVVVFSANAGGAWSPIGDVTTIMLWVGGHITSMKIIQQVFLPSLLAMIVPLLILSIKVKGNVQRPKLTNDIDSNNDKLNSISGFERKIIFFTGVSLLLFIPIFKALTHLPPFMAVLFGLGIMWFLTDFINRKKDHTIRSKRSILYVLSKIEIPTVLFFLGILIAVAGLESTGYLLKLATFLQESVGNMYAINLIIGLLSSIVDNVPLVAGAMGMYEIGPLQPGTTYPVDSPFWQFLAYSAGTGGSCLIIGSAAGIAVMGVTKMTFSWYLKKISLLSFIGYIVGAITYIYIVPH